MNFSCRLIITFLSYNVCYSFDHPSNKCQVFITIKYHYLNSINKKFTGVFSIHLQELSLVG